MTAEVETATHLSAGTVVKVTPQEVVPKDDKTIAYAAKPTGTEFSSAHRSKMLSRLYGSSESNIGSSERSKMERKSQEARETSIATPRQQGNRTKRCR